MTTITADRSTYMYFILLKTIQSTRENTRSAGQTLATAHEIIHCVQKKHHLQFLSYLHE